MGDEPTCAVTGPGFFNYIPYCNNGHLLFYGTYTEPDGSDRQGLWSGSDPDPNNNLIPEGAVLNLGFMEPNGTAYLVDTLNNQFYVAIDEGSSPSPVPEPGSIGLLGTGAISLFGAIRRKRFGVV